MTVENFSIVDLPGFIYAFVQNLVPLGCVVEKSIRYTHTHTHTHTHTNTQKTLQLCITLVERMNVV